MNVNGLTSKANPRPTPAATASTLRSLSSDAEFRPKFYARIGKRVFDVVGVLLLLPLVVPLILLFWMFTRKDGGPGLFGHHRIGQNGTRFTCWKLRTMAVDAEEQLAQHLKNCPTARAEWDANFKLAIDPRVTPLGNFLRKSSLDELPQFLNVLRGDMSLVGPRPVVSEELALYGTQAALYLKCKPGLTGRWQISGRNNISYAERVKMDVEYIQEMSLFRDLSIVLQTAFVVVKATGK